MNRRTLLAGAGLAVSTPLGGCLDGSSGDDPGSEGPVRPTELLDASFTTGIDAWMAADGPPRIAFDETAATVSVEGTVSHSSSSCGEVVLDHRDTTKRMPRHPCAW